MKEFEDIENCLSGIHCAISDIETELVFMRSYLLQLKQSLEDGQRRIEQI